MMNADQRRSDGTGFFATDDGAKANPLQPIDGRPLPETEELANARNAPDRLADALQALAIAERRLLSAVHENKSLRLSNDTLMRALDEAARMAVAAQRIAYHDRLTGLPNRPLLIKRLQMAIRNAAARHRQLALLFIDLDGFKVVNDRFGHSMADRLLSGVAARITTCVRGDDLACRYGGDEFLVLLTNLDDARRAAGIAEHIRARIAQPYSFEGTEICITASLGLAGYPADGECYEALLRIADASMYRDKAAHWARAEPSTAWGPPAWSIDKA